MRGPYLLLVVCLVGCSDADEAGGPAGGQGGGGATGSSSAGASSAGASTGGSGSAGANPGTGSAGKSNAGGSGAASSNVGGNQPSSVSPLELEPLAVGNVWNYTLSVNTPEVDCESGPGMRVVTKTLEYQGRTAFELQRFCDSEPSYHSADGGDVWQYLDGWYRNVAAPVAEGASWAFAPGFTLKWSSAGSVTVPAGTFSNCWKRSVVEFDGSITFCPGVGQVRIELPNLTAELASYDLAE